MGKKFKTEIEVEYDINMIEQKLRKKYHLPDSWACYCGPDDPHRLTDIDELLGYDEETYQKELEKIEKRFEFIASCTEADRADAHDCRKYANENGICTWCGRIISGCNADYELHGYDPNGTD